MWTAGHDLLEMFECKLQRTEDSINHLLYNCVLQFVEKRNFLG